MDGRCGRAVREVRERCKREGDQTDHGASDGVVCARLRFLYWCELGGGTAAQEEASEGDPVR